MLNGLRPILQRVKIRHFGQISLQERATEALGNWKRYCTEVKVLGGDSLEGSLFRCFARSALQDFFMNQQEYTSAL